MVVSTVFPDLMMDFTEAITKAVEVAEFEKWSPEDALQIAVACRELRQKMESFEEQLRRVLVQGVEVATFKARFGPLLSRWEKLASRHAAWLKKMGHVQGTAPAVAEAFTEFELLARTVGRVLDLLRNALDIADAPHSPIDWERVRAAQAAYLKGQTKPLHGAQEQNGM
jgi:hypothetical protein